MGAQLKRTEDNNNVVEFDDLWVNNKESYSSTPGVYVRQEQESEIDLLWGGLKDNKINTTSPIIYIVVGFIAGVVATLAASTILFWGTAPNQDDTINLDTANKAVIEGTQQGLNDPESKPYVEGSAAESSSTNYKDLESYEIKSGDSLGKIAIHFYGSSSPKYIKLIQETNNLATPNSITAGKKLLIPIKK